MKLLLLLLIVCLVAPSFEWRRRRRWLRIRIRIPKVIKGAALLARAGIIGKRGLDDLPSQDLSNVDNFDDETLMALEKELGAQDDSAE